MKKIDIKKWMLLGIWLFPLLAFAEDGLDEGIGMVASTGTLFGVIIVVVTVSLWMMPIAFAALVYTGQKKKAEQMHEEVGLKAAILSLLAAVLGAAMAFYIVGTIGKYSNADDLSLQQGNGYLIQKVIQPGINQLDPDYVPEDNDDNDDDGLGQGISMVASTAKLFGILIIVLSVSLWMLPIAFAGLVYTGQKKKSEQMHEEVGLKAAVLALLAGVLGAAMAYYIVGTIGKYAEYGKDVNDETLEAGNKYFLKAIVGSGADKIK